MARDNRPCRSPGSLREPPERGSLRGHPAVPRCPVASFKALGFDRKPRRALELLGGFILSVGMVGTTVLLFRLVSAFHLEPNPKATPGVALTGLTWYLKSSILEELLFRGYTFLRLAKWLGIPVAQWITAVAFALWHVASVGMPVMFPGAASLLFGDAFLRTRGVILPIAMHAAWNNGQEQIGMASGRKQIGLWLVVRDIGSSVHWVLGYAVILGVLSLAGLAI